MNSNADTHEDDPYEKDHLEEAASGAIRAAVFGVSDGLVSNLALVMGVAGGVDSSSTVVLAGVAGLLAGAFSMAAGEYISVRTQREVFEKELDTERRHISEYPEQEQQHLAKILSGHGFTIEDAEKIAADIHRAVDPALGFHARFELGINPDELGSPYVAATASFVAFIIGALIPLFPWFLADDGTIASLAVSALGLATVGGLLTRYTTRSPWSGAARQLAVGAAAAGVTYAVGSVVGTSV